MKVVHGYPPNIDEIAAALPDALRGDTIFCYGDTIYNSGSGNVSHALKAHEAVHSERQGKTDAEIREWWRKYVADAQFRFDEELPAHRAEYRAFCRLEHDKERRFRFLVGLAKRLSSTLYGSLTDFASAKQAIRSNESEMAA